ncbi:phosphoserine transaminase [Kiloniella sp. b19]|uniref:phosphoserine transaminase n=1 Tax=Kiloniella sp. GXU_MW_B19 TaxID=3141326 RepID=UPI0031D6F1CE
MTEQPVIKPANPCFSSGPCAKRPGWSVSALADCWSGRSHRASGGKKKLQQVIEKSRALLGIPEDYLLGIVPASDTGAVEMALWSLLGERGVDVLVWESFGKGWAGDIRNQLELDDLRILEAPYGELPALSDVDCDRDVVFTWNGTTSGVRVPDGSWIADNRKGLTICDATSAAFAQDLPWEKLDVVTWSWQKVLGGEAAHGMLALSPRAVERLESFAPQRPLPKIFRLTKDGKLIRGIFEGATINTPSMLAVEDALDSLNWAESIGGLPALHRRCDSNLAAVEAWVKDRGWVSFLAQEEGTLSNTSICLNLTESWFVALDEARQRGAIKYLCNLLEEDGIAYDIAGYRDAPPGLRIWGGATVETPDIEALLPWLDWAYAEVSNRYQS